MALYELINGSSEKRRRDEEKSRNERRGEVLNIRIGEYRGKSFVSLKGKKKS